MTARKKVRPQIFVLTSDEKKAVACVLGALALGLATQHYRAAHPAPPPPATAKEIHAAKIASGSAAGRKRAARRALAAANSTPAPEQSAED